MHIYIYIYSIANNNLISLSPHSHHIPSILYNHLSPAMAQYDQVPVAYPPPPTSYPAETYTGPYVMAPPPIGYPTRETPATTAAAAETTSRGDGFLKGCLAGLCCCCCLDCCF